MKGVEAPLSQTILNALCIRNQRSLHDIRSTCRRQFPNPNCWPVGVGVQTATAASATLSFSVGHSLAVVRAGRGGILGSLVSLWIQEPSCFSFPFHSFIGLLHACTWPGIKEIVCMSQAGKAGGERGTACRHQWELSSSGSSREAKPVPYMAANRSPIC